ncbi:hypothetical protein [Acrocarpospora sp. B8E8]|uniref:hypothetical protein n=1 Tax=Acrocarpospora sp. B8E8 TaxID=3153572 RepID=UPI00325DD983
MTATIAAIDLGASSGRVITARVGDQRLELTEVHRFPNRSVRLNARALGLMSSLSSPRALIAETQPLRHYEPTGSPAVWTDAATRLRTLTPA